MFTRMYMSKHVMTVDCEDSAISALRTMRKLSIRHLPVTERGALIGMVTERDLLRVLPSFVSAAPDQKTSPIPIRAALGEHLISLDPQSTIHAAAQLLLEHKISGLPVVDAGELLGILTSDDVLRAYVSSLECGAGSQWILVRGVGTSGGDDFDPARLCVRLGIRLLRLIQQDVRRGAEVCLICAQASDEQRLAFQEQAARFGWLPMHSSKPKGEDEAA